MKLALAKQNKSNCVIPKGHFHHRMISHAMQNAILDVLEMTLWSMKINTSYRWLAVLLLNIKEASEKCVL